MRVALAVPCYVDQLRPQAARATLTLLHRLGCDVSLGRVSYVVQEGTETRAVLTPWPARPTLALRLTTDLLAGGG